MRTARNYCDVAVQGYWKTRSLNSLRGTLIPKYFVRTLYREFAFGDILRNSRKNLRAAEKNILARIGRFVQFVERTYDQQSV